MISYDPINNVFSESSNQSDKLLQIMWHVTTKCNMNCSYCLGNKSKEYFSLTDNKIDNILKKICDIGVVKIDISGGEPMLFNNLVYLVQSCIKSKIFITITTSGDGITSNKLWLLNNWKNFTRIIFSLDGLEKTHNTLRGNEKAYSLFLSSYLTLKEKGCNILRINTVVTCNILSFDYLKEISKLILALQPREWCLIKPLININNQNRISHTAIISDDEFFSAISTCQAELKDSNIKIIYRTNKIYKSYWALTDEGLFTNNSRDNNICVPILETEIDELKRIISQHSQFLP